MEAWTTPEELRGRVRKAWDSGSLPQAVVADAFTSTISGTGSAAPADPAPRGPLTFPLRIALRGPTSAELGDRFGEARAWVSALAASEASPGYRLEWRELRHRQLGRNDLPVAAVFDTPRDALAFAGRQRDAERLLELALRIEGAFPSLRPWLLRRPLALLEHAREWPELLGTLAWFRSHPRSDLYVRQIDAPGVHSKFVEGHRALLSELLDLVLEPPSIDAEASGAAGFSRRYGLRDKPILIRIRSLDPGLPFGLGPEGSSGSSRIAQLALTAEDFRRLFAGDDPAPFEEAFVTENEINFLSFPARRASLIVFGSGYGFAHLATADWLRGCRLRYWGDLDTHGFAILDQFRSRFPHAVSFLMDRATLLAHRGLWTTEGTPTSAELSRLNPEEGELYDDLRRDRLAPSLRLEQERIAYSWVEAALSALA